MILKKKSEERPPILYEKYKRDHNLNKPTQSEMESAKTRQSLARTIGNMITLSILMVMIFLSAIGVITLLHPEMKMILYEMIGVWR